MNHQSKSIGSPIFKVPQLHTDPFLLHFITTIQPSRSMHFWSICSAGILDLMCINCNEHDRFSLGRPEEIKAENGVVFNYPWAESLTSFSEKRRICGQHWRGLFRSCKVESYVPLPPRCLGWFCPVQNQQCRRKNLWSSFLFTPAHEKERPLKNMQLFQVFSGRHRGWQFFTP